MKEMSIEVYHNLSQKLCLGTYVRGNMDSIAICIFLQRAICILQKFLGNINISSKHFLFRRKESILHLYILPCNMDYFY